MRRFVSVIVSAAMMCGAATAQQTAAPTPLAERAADALERVTWRTRTLVGDDRLTQWKLAVRPAGLSFLEAVVRADAAVVSFVEASSTQRVSREIDKTLDDRLTEAEIASIRARMGTIRVLAYRVDALAADAAARRRVFAFARAMGADTIVLPAGTAPAGLGALADEIGVNVAILTDTSGVTPLVSALAGASARVGVGIDTGLWAQDGVTPQDGLAKVGDRLRYVNLRDRSGRGAGARNVRLGEGAGQLPALFHELNRLNRRPLAMTLDTTDLVAAPSDLFTAIAAFEAAVQPAYGQYVTQFSKTRPIRWDLVSPREAEKLTPAEVAAKTEATKQQIEAALPRTAYAKPKKARKLLVIESLHGMSHNTIPHTNVMLQRLGAVTGAWTAEFNNDLDLLKYPAIKAYDGVFLNSIVGEALADPAVREGLSRFVREGGGLGGIHGTPWASRNWNEFAEIIGAQDAPHRIERGVMRIFDPASPLVKPLGGQPITMAEEYYRFEHEGRSRLRWEQVHVVLTVALDDPAIEPRPWPGYKRPDNIYPVSWIRSYGKGRVFYSSIGHMPETFTTPALVGHFLAGVQFLLGDLEADTTPNPPAAATSR
jgi:type 1 glutamine amidotransferase/sugar phosphate isomerase/epimerase